jgi:hypothetical protein
MPPTGPPELSAAEREALASLAGFPLLDAIFGRRSRRFPMGGEIPDGPLAYQSQHEHVPLSELERHRDHGYCLFDDVNQRLKTMACAGPGAMA